MGAKGEPGPMGTPGVKVSDCWVLIEDSNWRGCSRVRYGPQPSPASESLSLLLQGQPGLPGPPGLPVSSTYKCVEGPSGGWEDLQMGAVNLISFISLAGPRICWPSRKL